MLLPWPDLQDIAHGPWHFGDFRNILIPNIGEDQEKVSPSERGAPGYVPYGKSGPCYCVTFIKRFDAELQSK